MNKNDREYVIQTSVETPWEIRLAFIEGRIIPGMSVDLVNFMYGQPDLSLPCPNRNECDRVWIYETDNTHVVGSVSFKNWIVVGVNGQMKNKAK